MPVSIGAVAEGSPAHAAGVRAGMRLVAIDGHEIFDGLDYEFYSAAPRLRLTLDAGGERREAEVSKGEYEPLGCVFDSYLIDRHRTCKNRCVFCFIDQLPKGLRPSLYFKDDDERLGFLFGNYITLTNLSEREIARIVEMRFSPVNISVHTANPALRSSMMGSRAAGESLAVIPRLARAGVEMNFQLVLCPGVNDGDELKSTLEWLLSLGECVRSIAAVPVGLTRHREGLAGLRPYTRGEAGRQLELLLRAGERAKAQSRGGARIVYPSDEWFLLAGRPVPGADFYGGYPQIENGVGMWRLFRDEFLEAVRGGKYAGVSAGADVPAGVYAAPLMRELAGKLADRYPDARLFAHEVRNDFFGHGVTVTGLLTGADMAAQLAGKLRTGRLILPRDVLRAEGDIMLDGWTPQRLGDALGVRVRVAERGGQGLLDALFCADGEA